MLSNKTDAAFLDVATETATSVALVLVPVATSTFGPPAVLALVHANNLTAQKNPPATLRTHPAAELMPTSPSSTRNGRNQSLARPAPPVPVIEVSAQALEPAARQPLPIPSTSAL